jgi:hypothetical protein
LGLPFILPRADDECLLAPISGGSLCHWQTRRARPLHAP